MPYPVEGGGQVCYCPPLSLTEDFRKIDRGLFRKKGRHRRENCEVPFFQKIDGFFNKFQKCIGFQQLALTTTEKSPPLRAVTVKPVSICEAFFTGSYRSATKFPYCTRVISVNCQPHPAGENSENSCLNTLRCAKKLARLANRYENWCASSQLFNSFFGRVSSEEVGDSCSLGFHTELKE